MTTAFISPRVRTDSAALILGQHATIYGPSMIGPLVVIESGAIIGHPRQAAIDLALSDVRADLRPHSSLEEFYEQVVESGVTIGARSIIRSGTTLYDGASVGEFVSIAHNSVVREDVTIGDHSSIFPLTSIRTAATIGRHCRVAGVVGDRTVLSDFVTCHGFCVHEYKVGIGGIIEEAPRVRLAATVGRGAILVGAVEIGEYALVSAGSVVRKDVEPYAVVSGDPARVIGRRATRDIEQLAALIEQERS